MLKKEYKKIKTLNDWLLRNSYEEEADHLDFIIRKMGQDYGVRPDAGVTNIPLYGPRARQILEDSWERRKLSQDLPDSTLIDNIQFGLDLAGFVPGLGEIADFINTIIYIIRKKWFEAALTVLAMVPFLGIASTLLKRLVPKEEAIELIAKNIAESGVSVDLVRQKTDELLDGLRLALENLEKSMPEEYARNIPKNSLALVKQEIDEILGRVVSTYAPNKLEEVTNLPNALQRFWKNLGVEGEALGLVIRIFNTATEKALVRTANFLGKNLMPKLKGQLPDLTEEKYELIAEEVKKEIRRIDIERAHDLSGVVGRFGPTKEAAETLGVYSPDLNVIVINIPAVALYARSISKKIDKPFADAFTDALFETIQHEINHNLDGIIGRVYHKVTGVQEGLTFMTRTKGIPIADWIAEATQKGLLKGSEYLMDAPEIHTRMTNLKAFFKNNGAEQIMKLVENNGDKLDDNALRLLRGASSAKDGHSMIGAILYLKNEFPEIWGKISKNIEYEDEISELASIIDYEKFASDPGLLVNLIEAL